MAGALALAAATRAQDARDADGGPPPRRGPTEIRDEHLLAQPRLTLPPVTPHTLPRGVWEAGVSLMWSNSFSWTQDQPGEQPADRRFLIDGEAFTLDTVLRRGVGANVDVALRLPFRHRGGGWLDTVVDAWHRVLHLPNGDRPLFRRNAFRLEGVTTAGRPFSWNDRGGYGLGALELETRWRLRDGGVQGISAALVVRASLPTSTGAFAGNGLGGGGQLVLDAPLSQSFDLYGGMGFTAQDPGPVGGVLYEPGRVHGFAALEWRPWRRVSLVVETDAASRLAQNIDSYPGLHWIVNVTGRIDITARTRLDVGFTENMKDQQATTDFALFLAVGLRR